MYTLLPDTRIAEHVRKIMRDITEIAELHATVGRNTGAADATIVGVNGHSGTAQVFHSITPNIPYSGCEWFSYYSNMESAQKGAPEPPSLFFLFFSFSASLHKAV